MARGTSIHIGLNKVDVSHYGDSGQLPYCINDAKAMRLMAKKAGFEPQKPLIDKKATACNVLAALQQEASRLKSGDILLITYSGHGSYFTDLNGDEKDGYDETWVLYDRMLLDDELYYAWSKFESGVRIIVISDSCHSGTVAKPLLLGSDRKLRLAKSSSLQGILKAESNLLYKRHKDKYDTELTHVPAPDKVKVNASVILLASSADNERSYALCRSGNKLSLFTDELLAVWNLGVASYTYKTFLEAIQHRIPSALCQSPNYYVVGKPNKAFENQSPFTI